MAGGQTREVSLDARCGSGDAHRHGLQARIAAIPDVWRLHAGVSKSAGVCQTDVVRLPPRKLSLISSLGEVGLAVVGGRLAFSMFQRGNVLLGILMVTLSVAAVVLAVRYLREYRNLRATESES